MNYQEAIEILKKNKPTSDPRRCGTELCEAVDMAIEALNKQIPKKPYYYGDGYSSGELVYDMAECPNCGNDDFEEGINNWGCNYCPECGQKLNWSEEEND